MEDTIPDMKKIYKEYLAEEDLHHRSQSLNLAQSCTALFKYLGVRLAMTSLTYPFESTILLRQIQHGSSSEGSANAISEDEDNSPAAASPTIEEQIEAYEKYLLRPPASIRPLLEEAPDGTQRPILTDPLGYITKPPTNLLDPRGLALTANTKLPLVLDKKISVISSLSQVTHRHGFFSLWQGFSAHYTLQLSNDFLKNVAAEAFVMTPLGTKFISNRGVDSLSVSLAFSALDSFCSFCLSPFEVAKVHLLGQSFFYGEKRLNGIFDALNAAHTSFGTNGLYPTPLLTGVSKLLQEVSKIIPAFFLEWLVTRFALDTSSAIVQTLLVGSELFLINASLFLTLPLETVRNRMIAAQLPIITKPRIPIQTNYASSWHCLRSIIREEGIEGLYQGLGFRVLQNTLGLMSAWLLHLNGASLEEEGEEDGF